MLGVPKEALSRFEEEFGTATGAAIGFVEAAGILNDEGGKLKVDGVDFGAKREAAGALVTVLWSSFEDVMDGAEPTLVDPVRVVPG